LLIGRDKIREIVERTDIVQLIGRHVQLKRAGRSFKGLCPFHGERTPSFYVTPERHSYKCFGCQKGGDAIRFVMEYEGKDFMTAVRGLAQDAGVPIAFDPEEERRFAQRRQLLRACQVAAAWFEEQLHAPTGRAGREHLVGRGVSEDTARAAGLGYAPTGFHGLRDRLLREGVGLEHAVAAGLLGLRDRAPGSDADRAYDVFRGRLMIPIRDPDGRVIAFGGRVVEGDDERKYINSRETPLYVKSRVLYGLDVARDAIRRTRSAVLVEGYFDAIALWEAGIPNAVALCSTALTAEHIALLKRLDVTDLTLLLDGDDAGRKASVRLAGPILAAGLAARVVELPEGQDPDTFVKARGKAGYENLAEVAPPLSAFVIEGALGDAGGSYEDKLRSLGQLRPVVAALPEDAARSLFLAELARRLGIGVRDVAGFFRGDRPAEDPGARPAAQDPRPRPAGEDARAPLRSRRGPVAGRAPAHRRELELVAGMFAYPTVAGELGASIAAAVSDDALRELAGALLAGDLGGDELLARTDPGLAEALRARIREARRVPEKDWRAELEGGLLHLEFERLKAERSASIEDREALAAHLARATEPEERERLAESLEESTRHAEAIRAEMERLRERLRGVA